MYISDLTHFLDDKGEIPKSMPKAAREMAGFLKMVVSSATTTPANPTEQEAEIRCFKPGCKGNVVSIIRYNTIYWFCSGCNYEGHISNWQNTKWDLRSAEQIRLGTMNPAATRESFQNETIVNPVRIDCYIELEQIQFEKLRWGNIPEGMDDKWFIFYEQGWLYLHRSWTGAGIFKAQVVEEAEKYVIREFYAARNPHSYGNTDEEKDKELFEDLIKEYFQSGFC